MVGFVDVEACVDVDAFVDVDAWVEVDASVVVVISVGGGAMVPVPCTRSLEAATSSIDGVCKLDAMSWATLS